MNKTLTFFLAIVALLLLAIIFFFRSSVPGTTENKLLGSYVFHFEVDDVQDVTITRGDEQITFQRDGEGWKLHDKITDAASQSAVEEILSLAQNLRVIDIINAKEIGHDLRLADFGLSRPKQRLSIKLTSQTLELYFGEEGPTNQNVFVRRAGSKGVFLVSDDLLEAITRPIDEFRDRRLAAISADHIEKISIARPSLEIELQRKSADQWEITSPLRTPADAQKVETLLEHFLGSAIQRFLPSAAPSTTSSSSESITEIKLWPEGKDEPLVFRLSTPTPEEQHEAVLPVYSSARQDWFLIPIENTEFANSTITSLRSHYFFPLNPDTIDSIQITKDGQSVLLRRAIDTAQEGEADAWMRRIPSGMEVPVKQPIAKLVEKLSKIQATDFLPFNPNSPEGLALSNPTLKLEFNSWLSENTPEAIAGNHRIATLTIALDSGGQLLARVNESPEICHLPADATPILDALIQSAGSMQSPK